LPTPINGRTASGSPRIKPKLPIARPIAIAIAPKRKSRFGFRSCLVGLVAKPLEKLGRQLLPFLYYVAHGLLVVEPRQVAKAQENHDHHGDADDAHYRYESASIPSFIGSSARTGCGRLPPLTSATLRMPPTRFWMHASVTPPGWPGYNRPSVRGSPCTSFVGAIAALAAAQFYIGQAAAQGQQAVTAGELVVEPPTLISLGFEWYIEGDANRNAAVAVAYRQSGESAWHESLPLLRVQNEHTFYTDTLWYVAPNMFAGSVFELKENTEYEVRFKLTDADGAGGEPERVVKVRTRAEPQAATGGHTYHGLSVRLQRPATGAGVQRPARGLLQELARR